MVYAVINRFTWFLDMLGNSTSQTCRTTYFRGQGQRITLQWPLQLYWSWSCKSWVMGVFWTGDSYSDNDFVVKVIHRVNIDLHMTFRLAIGLQVCSIGYWVFSTRQLVWCVLFPFDVIWKACIDLHMTLRLAIDIYRVELQVNLIRWIPLFFLGKMTCRLVLLLFSMGVCMEKLKNVNQRFEKTTG